MRKTGLVLIALAVVPGCAFAVDGVVLINQSTVVAAGGFPYTITQPGSYKLSGNLTVPNANTTAISITVDNVSLDLNGFSIIGPTVCTGFPITSCNPTGSGNGVESSGKNAITVVNGSVRGMGRSGIELTGGSGCHVEKVQARSNGTVGIVVSTGFGDTVTGSSGAGNGFAGIFANYATVRDSSAASNKAVGIYSFNSTLIGNIVTSNGESGIQVSQSSTVSSNTANGSLGIGILVTCPSSVVGNTASSNTGRNLVTVGAQATCVLANNSTSN